jgi:ribosomal protein S27E
LIFIARLPRSCAIIGAAYSLATASASRGGDVSGQTEIDPQFEHMEPRAGATETSCAACQRKISDVYYEAARRIFCPACRDAVLAAQSGGSGATRLARAIVFGLGAAAVSAVVWYGITELTGYQLGIVAIAVGFAVGFAVRAGSDQRGGPAYQAIAVVFTYLAIAASYVPLLLAEAEPVGIVLAIAVALTIPVLQATEGTGIIGLLIVGFALYEAWRLNKRQTITWSGPFRLQRTA